MLFQNDRRFGGMKRPAAFAALAAAALGFIATLSGAAEPARVSPEGAWKLLEREQIEARRAANVRPWIQPRLYQAVELDRWILESTLDAAPMEFTEAARQAPVTLTLPTPDGAFERFSVVESPIAHPDLYRWVAEQGYPMKTYKLASLDRPATSGRADWGGYNGFHAMVTAPEGGTYFIDTLWQGEETQYASYLSRNNERAAGKEWHCGFQSPTEAEIATGDYAFLEVDHSPDMRGSGGALRVYRAAVSAAGEYTNFFGGDTAKALTGGVMTTVNRVSQVYERDLSIRLSLVANNNLLIYPNPSTDPFNLAGDVFAQNTSVLNSNIGSGNYDIGHLVANGDGGFASLGSVCSGTRKAWGFTGSNIPVGDNYDIDYVAHEMGHQFGGDHTFNGQTGSCGGGNRTGSSAYEPGSGATIMAYAGICSPDDLQAHSDDFFHRRSLDQIRSFVASSGNCSANTANVNPNAPVADAGPNYTIPLATPFELTPGVAVATDADGDALTYCWEQYDLGAAASTTSGDLGSGPIIRSWDPTTEPVRIVPRKNTMLGNQSAARGEILPTTARTLNFRLTVRDNNPAGGRESDDQTTLTVVNPGGLFRVTFPNTNVALGNDIVVTWTVANTDMAPISAANVDIWLSTNGGQDFDTLLLANTPNDGSETVILPFVDTTTARIKVKASNNIFFDVSNTNFAILGPAAATTDWTKFE